MDEGWVGHAGICLRKNRKPLTPEQSEAIKKALEAIKKPIDEYCKNKEMAKMNKKIIIYGGGTVNFVRQHLALAAPAYGKTSRFLAEKAPSILPNLDVDLRLTKMAGGSTLETNEDISKDIDQLLQTNTTKVIVMSAALCDFNGYALKKDEINPDGSGKYSKRLNSDENCWMYMEPAHKIISGIRSWRKDIFLVGFKTTCGFDSDSQYLAGLNLLKKSSCNLVFANDVKTRNNMIVTPEESRYHEGQDREAALIGLLTMIFHRSHLSFTRSTVVDGQPIPWSSDAVPSSLREVVNYCIKNKAYKPFNGATVGHFACKIDDNTFLTSIRKTNFNDLEKNGLVKVVTDGPDTVLAYGAKPSVGGQSQRIIFRDHPGYDCIVHFHCERRVGSKVPVVSQYENECGSHACGNNTSKGLGQFGNIKAVFLDNHGPNIIFNKNINPQEVINFIEENFDLSTKTGGFVEVKNVS